MQCHPKSAWLESKQSGGGRFACPGQSGGRGGRFVGSRCTGASPSTRSRGGGPPPRRRRASIPKTTTQPETRSRPGPSGAPPSASPTPSSDRERSASPAPSRVPAGSPACHSSSSRRPCRPTDCSSWRGRRRRRVCRGVSGASGGGRCPVPRDWSTWPWRSSASASRLDTS